MANQNACAGLPAEAAGLSAEEWHGLAQLGSLMGTLSAALQNGSGTAATGALRCAGDLYERYELPELLEELFGALKALRDSGLLAAVRENAQLIMQTVELLQPLAGKTVAALNELPIERWRQNLATLDRLLTQARALSDFVNKHLAGELTELVVKLTALAEETDAEATAIDALRTVARMRRNGTLTRLADLSDHVAAFTETVNTSALVGDWVVTGEKSPKGGLMGLVALLFDPAVQRGLGMLGQAVTALEDGQTQITNGKRGGWGGLIKLLKDPDTQHSIHVAVRTLAVLQKDGDKLPAAH